MKTTGIIRRVDDLGRIVIPREYRRAYDINIGDPMEIIADNDGNIILKRVDIISEFKRVSEGVAAFLSEQFGWTVIIADKQRFLTGFGKKKNYFIGRELSDNLKKLVVGAHRANIELGEFEYIALPNDELFYSGAMEPIICERGVIGAVFAVSPKPLEESDLKMLTLSARLIGNNMQKY